ncbi:MAG: translation initiation factor IF-2 subunit beta [Candidatus Micrarchaeia archaeon]
MTDNNEYENLLDNIYSNLPKQTSSGSRFERPEFDSFFEGNKTIIKNIDLVCSKLRRDKQFLIKYLTKELATPIVIDGERAILQRKVYQNILKDKLDYFIKEYVICKVCEKPDTNIVNVGNFKELVCEACGARRPVK